MPRIFILVSFVLLNITSSCKDDSSTTVVKGTGGRTGQGGAHSTGGMLGSGGIGAGSQTGGTNAVGGHFTTGGMPAVGGGQLGGMIGAGGILVTDAGIQSDGVRDSSGDIAATAGQVDTARTGLGGSTTRDTAAGGNSMGGSTSGGTTSANGCPTELIGFAAVESVTSGGGDVPPTIVKTYAELKAAVSDNTPRVVVVSGTIKTTDGDGYGLPIGSNKTIQGADKSATIYGGIAITGVNNVIVRNLNIHGIYPNSGPDDAIAVKELSHHIWLDHLNVWDSGDGSLDITRQASYVTVSWCKFWYTQKSHPHRLCSLIGSGGGDHPEDWGYLKVTYHHNWFAELVDQRMPRLVYGQAHVFNDYYTSSGNSYCVGVGSYGSALVENNYFKNVNDPISFMYDVHCEIVSRGNVFDNTTGKRDNGHGGSRHASGQTFKVEPFTTPPYPYSMDKAEEVPALVSKCAGPQ